MEHTVINTADGTKLLMGRRWKVGNTFRDRAVIQRALGRLKQGNNRDHMKLNKAKCQVLPLGWRSFWNDTGWRQMGWGRTDMQDGPWWTSSCAPSWQRWPAAFPAAWTRSWSAVCREGIIPFYSALIRRHLWYYVQFSPTFQYEKDINKLEHVEQKTTKMAENTCLISEKLGFFSLEKRWPPAPMGKQLIESGSSQ